MDQSIYYVTDYHDANFVNKIIERIFKDKKLSSISVLDGFSSYRWKYNSNFFIWF